MLVYVLMVQFLKTDDLKVHYIATVKRRLIPEVHFHFLTPLLILWESACNDFSQ